MARRKTQINLTETTKTEPITEKETPVVQKKEVAKIR